MTLNPTTNLTAKWAGALWNKCVELFAIDTRSLAAFRIGVAGILLIDLWYRGREITAYFTDAGVLPRTARIELFSFGDDFGFQDQWSLHMYCGETWAQLVLMWLAAMFAGWLLVGYRTRLAAIVSWILLMSLDGRNPVLLNSGDVLLRSMLLWSLFLPLGARFSIDAWRAGKGVQLPSRVGSMASVALLLQLCSMYWFSTVFKMQSLDDMPSPWTSDYSAVYYALNCDAYATRIGLWLRQFPELMRWLTGFSLWLELIGPLLAFSPCFTKWFRGGIIAVFAAFHIGLGLCLTIGLFPVICIVSWLVFVPSELWNWTEAKVWRGSRDQLPQRVRNTAIIPISSLINRFRSRWNRPWYGELKSFVTLLVTICSFVTFEFALFALFVYMVLWNVRETDFKYWEPRVLSRSWNKPARILGLDQNWSMFAPLPRTEDGWLVMEGTLHDGSVVNLWQFDEPLPWSKPPLVSATYRTQRWRKYLDNLTTDGYAAHRMYFCQWLARRWNEQHAEGLKSREVHKVELSHRIELTPPPGLPLPEPETRVLWTWYFE